MRRSNPSKYARQRFGRKVTTLGARHMGLDIRAERLRTLALVAQAAGTQSAQARIYARRVMTGKRV